MSNIKLNPTFKSNVEYRITNSIQHSNRMLNIEYQTKSHIQILNVEYQSESNIQSVNVRIRWCCSIYNQLLAMTIF